MIVCERTVEPLFSGHPWDKTICPLNRGVLNMEVACICRETTM